MLEFNAFMLLSDVLIMYRVNIIKFYSLISTINYVCKTSS